MSFPQFVIDMMLNDGAANIAHPTIYMEQASSLNPPEVINSRV